MKKSEFKRRWDEICDQAEIFGWDAKTISDFRDSMLELPAKRAESLLEF